MIFRMHFLATVLIGLSLVPFCQAQKSILWEVSGPGLSSSHLFGTYHLIGSDYLQAQPEVLKRFEESSAVVVETVIDSTQLMSLAGMAFMPESRLSDFYNSAEYESLATGFELATGTSLSSMVQMKPIAIAMIYAVTAAQQELNRSGEHFSGQPMDLYFAGQASQSGKSLHALESMVEQMEMIYDSEPLDKQAVILLEMISDPAANRDMTLQLLEAYLDQDLEAMWNLSEEEDSYWDLTFLLNDRNAKWMEKLQPVLQEGNAFIAVGALHLPGKGGLLRLLKEAGYKVRPVEF